MNNKTGFIATLVRAPYGPAAPPAPAPSRRLRVLVVDDDLATRQLYCLVLARAGYTTEVAADGEEAWEALLSRSFDLLLTDHNMPRLSGLELVARIRAAGMMLPVIVSSGCLEAVADAGPGLTVLQKPIGPGGLVEAVKRVLPLPPDAEPGTFRESPRLPANVIPVPLLKVLPPPGKNLVP